MCRINAACCIGVRNAQHFTGAKSIDVCAVKGIAVGTIQSHQHLVERHPRQCMRSRNPIQGVAATHDVGIRRSARRCRARGCWRLAGCRRQRRHIHGCGEGALRDQIDWIEQKGIFTRNAPIGPVELDQQVHKRIIDGTIAGQSDDRARGARIDADPDRRHRSGIGDVGLSERIGRPDACQH